MASAAGAQAAIMLGRRPRIPSGAHPDPEVAAIREENRGLLALADGDPEGAAERFRSAIDVWETLGLTSWLARALGFHADALRRAGRRRAEEEAARERAAVLAALAAPRRDRGPKGGDGQPPSARSRKSAAVQENRSAP